MQCQKCQFENPEGKKFCGQCGAKMERICPDCNASNPPQFKFCGECGHNLTGVALPEKKPPAFDSERKHATVLFSDLVGYTAMTERLDPEDVKEIMSRIFQEIAQVITKYGGVIERFFGDEVMALFGVPKAHEDDPVRAIRAAREIHRTVEDLSPKYEAKIDHPLLMHIGINTGLLVTGDEYIGKGRHGLTGDAVNLAARLAKFAQAGETLVAPDTYRRSEGYFIFEQLEPKRVKGKEKPVRVYQVIAPSTRRTRFDVSAERGLTPLVGRKRELDQLKDGFERCKAGRGQAFSIVSEAGLGKSRLLYEFRKALAKEDVTFLEGKCLSYSKGVAYQPVIDILKSTFDIMEGDGDSEVREKVIKGLKILGADETSILPYILEILSFKDSGLDQISMSPEAKKDRIIEALKRISFKGSEIRPLIMAVEDLHWIDKSSEDAIKDLLNSLSGTRIFLIVTYRPEYVPSWGAKSYHSQINLNRLSERQSLSMVTQLLGTPEIDRSLKDLITEKAEGAPFFIEEFIKSLKELRIIEKIDKYYLAKNIEDIAIPSTIQDVIMARVDALPEGAKAVLQTGSVIEREFSYELITYVMDLPEQVLLSHLSSLRDSELIYERGISPQSTYIFKHALARDVVYDSILIKRRKLLHEQVGNAIEELYKDSIHEHYEVMAKHYIASESYEKAAAYSKLASKKAESAGALTDAIRCARKGIASLEKLPITDEVQGKIIDFRTVLGLYLFQVFYFSEAKKAIHPISDVAINNNYRKRIAQIYSILGAYTFWCEEDIPEAFNKLELALKIAEETNDVASVFFSNQYLAIAKAYNCEFDKAIDHFNEALGINVMRNAIWGISVLKSSISYWGYNFQGKIDMAYQTSQEAIEIAEESGDIYSKACAYGAHGPSCFFKGYFQEAELNLLIAMDFCERIRYWNMEINNLLLLVMVYLEMKDIEAAEVHCIRAIELADKTDAQPSTLILIKIYIELVRLIKGQANIDLEMIYFLSAENKLRVYEGWIRRLIGKIILNLDNSKFSDAESWIESAIKKDRRNKATWNLGIDYAVYAEMFKRRDDQAKAREKLRNAIEILDNCGADGWVEKYSEELERLQ